MTSPRSSSQLISGEMTTTLADIPYEVLTGPVLQNLDIEDILHLGTTNRYFQTVASDVHFWRQLTLKTFRLPPQPIRQKGWYELYKRLSTAKAVTWGFNEFGRLGHSYHQGPGTVRMPLYQRAPAEIESLGNEVVVDISCGGWSTWALTSSGNVYGWGKVEGDTFQGRVLGVPALIEFSEPIQRISAGRRCCLALAESGDLFIVDVDFTWSLEVKFTIDIVQAELPSKRYFVQHMAVGWHFAAAVIKDIGLVVWKTDVPEYEPYPPTLKQRNVKARLIERSEETDNDPTDAEIIGLMVGDGYLVYLTKAGTVHRANVNDDTFSATIPLSSFLLEQFKTTPQLSYLSGSFRHFGLFNTAGQVLIGNISTQQTTPPLIPPGLQNCGIIGLSWGDWHAVALCEDGSMLSWGKELRANGCLGMGYRDLEEARRMGLIVERMDVGSVVPRKIKGFGGMEDKFAFCVAAAGWHSAALVADFKVVEPRRREW